MTTAIAGYDTVAVFVGLDVGKSERQAVALDRTGKRPLDRALPQDETRLRQIITELQTHGPVLVVVDQPATVGALPVAVARSAGATLGHLPELAMRRIADLHPRRGENRCAGRGDHRRHRSHPASHTPPDRRRGQAGRRTDDALRLRRRPRAADHPSQQPHPRTAHPDPPRPGTRHRPPPGPPRNPHPPPHTPSPDAVRAAGTKRLGNLLLQHAPRKGRVRPEEIVAALRQQTVTVTGTNAASLVLPRLSEQLHTLRTQRDEVAAEVEHLVEAHPLHPVLTSMPGVGVRTAVRLLTEVAGKNFPTAAHLAAYAGLAPVTGRSGTSIRGEHPSRHGNKTLKRALFLSTFAALRDRESRAYYNRKTTQGKCHNQALIALARRRTDVLYAMLRDGTVYQPRPPLTT